MCVRGRVRRAGVYGCGQTAALTGVKSGQGGRGIQAIHNNHTHKRAHAQKVYAPLCCQQQQRQHQQHNPLTNQPPQPHHVGVCACGKRRVDIRAPVHCPEGSSHPLALHKPGANEVVHQVILPCAHVAPTGCNLGAHGALLLCDQVLQGWLLLLLLHCTRGCCCLLLLLLVELGGRPLLLLCGLGPGGT